MTRHEAADVAVAMEARMCGDVAPCVWGVRGGGGQVRKRHFFCPLFILKMIILPRQARDKHREGTQKERWRFLTGRERQFQD